MQLQSELHFYYLFKNINIVANKVKVNILIIRKPILVKAALFIKVFFSNLLTQISFFPPLKEGGRDP
jgi:hypothetical protein